MIEHAPFISTPIEFEVNGRPCTCPAERALEPLLDYLRGQSGLTGTKEGCRTGECGACMVLLGNPTGWQAITSCLHSLGQTHGQRVVTIEGVGALVNSTLHPAQEAMIACRAAQCGFCTPGMVMALASGQATDHASSTTVGKTFDPRAVLSGNLCRCTGYRPILDAAIQLTSRKFADPIPVYVSRVAPASRRHGEQFRFFSPVTLDELLSLRRQYPEAVLLAGGTDLMTHWNASGIRPALVISTRDVVSFCQTASEPDHLRIGASVTLREVFSLLLDRYPELDEYLRRFASPAINTMATLAGNLQTASPIGDMIPLMMVLGACVELSTTTSTRRIAITEFYRAYRTTVIGPDEVITAVLLPHRQTHQRAFAYKVAKRFDQDISTLTAVASITIRDSVVEEVSICFGGMSAINHRAAHTEDSLIGKPLDTTTIESACLALQEDYSPISDLRGSSDYRRRVAGNLLRKMHMDYIGTEPTSAWQASRS